MSVNAKAAAIVSCAIVSISGCTDREDSVVQNPLDHFNEATVQPTPTASSNPVAMEPGITYEVGLQVPELNPSYNGPVTIDIKYYVLHPAPSGATQDLLDKKDVAPGSDQYMDFDPADMTKPMANGERFRIVLEVTANKAPNLAVEVNAIYSKN